MQSRTFPQSFRSPLDGTARCASIEDEDRWIRFQCQCGKWMGGVMVASPPQKAFRCHCRKCRRFFTSSFAALVPIEDPMGYQKSMLFDENPIFKDECASLGPTQRVFCSQCRSSLGMYTKGMAYIAMGALDERVLSRDLAGFWQVVHAVTPPKP